MESNPILITGADRSGSSLIARILYMCGAFSGSTNNMYENIQLNQIMDFFISLNSKVPEMPDFRGRDFENYNWRELVLNTLQTEGLKDSVFFCKGSAIAQTWPIWNAAFPKAKWLIVRRKPGGIIRSCVQTAYMKRFKSIENRKYIGVKTEEEGWLWWIHQYEEKFNEIARAVSDCTVVWPERMANGDFEQIKQIVNACGLQWKDDIINKIEPLLRKGGN